MRLIVDTQILIRLLLDESISDKVRTLLTDPDNDVLIPHICLFEIVIKQKIGKLPKLSWPTLIIVQQLLRDGFALLPVNVEHIAAYDQIPLFTDHRDPFDRLLIATALAENIPIISADKNFKLYTAQIALIET
ncbi:type II toxin-antitoxin system VapC family toxin [Salmonirosea aquatica]|uniref:PIN domain-containing protein n=1 Tax=Salmonirosea aquatica TaxID=2654236 RepID=A0A7C9BGE3_9BACT|nr:PIN domain-containing protein [Cytophagaceae bacterium SJW1-29]